MFYMHGKPADADTKKTDHKHLPLTHARVCNPAKQGKENPDSRGD